MVRPNTDSSERASVPQPGEGMRRTGLIDESVNHRQQPGVLPSYSDITLDRRRSLACLSHQLRPIAPSLPRLRMERGLEKMAVPEKLVVQRRKGIDD